MNTASQAAKARVPDESDKGEVAGRHQHGKRLSDRLIRLAGEDRSALQGRWLQAFGMRPPARLSSELLVLGLSYHAQSGANGGLSPDDCVVLGLDGPDWLAGSRSPRPAMETKPSGPKTRAAAFKEAQDPSQSTGLTATDVPTAADARPARAKPRPLRRSIKPGTRLLRTWQGQTHEVIAESTGQFLYRGETYRSLSAIARAITGTRWSGPTFFGIATPAQAMTSQARISQAVACEAQIAEAAPLTARELRATAARTATSVAAASMERAPLAKEPYAHAQRASAADNIRSWAARALKARTSMADAGDDQPSKARSSADGNHRHPGPRNE